jgi:hypothetical protein
MPKAYLRIRQPEKDAQYKLKPDLVMERGAHVITLGNTPTVLMLTK